MRYRSFNMDGLSVSAITVKLEPDISGAFERVCAALELGVNSFSLAAADPEGADALRRAAATVGRQCLVVILRADEDGRAMEGQVRAALQATGVGRFDLLMPERPVEGELPVRTHAALEDARRAGLTQRIGIVADLAAATSALDAYDIDVLGMRYSVSSGWAERNLLKLASARGVTIFGVDHHLEDSDVQSAAPTARGLGRLFRRPAVAETPKAYAFLERTPGWTPRQVTLAYTLNEPTLASVVVAPSDAGGVQEFADAVERPLPAGVAAQIEMARFTAEGEQAA